MNNEAMNQVQPMKMAVGEAEVLQADFEDVLLQDDDSFSGIFENMDSKFQDLNGCHLDSLESLTSRTLLPEIHVSSSTPADGCVHQQNISFCCGFVIKYSNNTSIQKDFDDLSLRIQGHCEE